MRVVVTGATGFVGAQVVRELARGGDDVFAVVRSTSDPRRLSDLPGVARIEADVLKYQGRIAIAAAKPDVCVHAAWYAEPGKYLWSLLNVDLMAATLSLARALAEGGCRRFVGIGTCFEYDTSAGYLSEKTPLAPLHLYSAAKAGTYLALRQLGVAAKMQVCWARLFYLYGPDEYKGRLVPSVARALLRGEEARSTPGAQVRDFLHVDDAASAIAALARSDVQDAVNVASGEPVTVASIVQQVAALCQRPDLVRLGALPYASGDPMFICADTRKLAATPWRARWTMGDGLADAVSWWRKAALAERTDTRRGP
ncbi:MAG: NAD-dependent epimerase/dehydratase family protein [Polyangiaceae bacterium]